MEYVYIKAMARRILIVIVLFLFILVPVSAGVGIAWSKESEVVTAGQKICIQYGVYNPFSKNVSIILKGNLAAENPGLEALTAESEVKEVPAGTSHTENIPVILCFYIPDNVFEEDCIIGDFILCEQKCYEEDIYYYGEITATEVKEMASGGTGSAAIAVASVPFTLRVTCVERSMDWTFVYLLIIALIIIAIALAYKYKYR